MNEQRRAAKHRAMRLQQMYWLLDHFGELDSLLSFIIIQYLSIIFIQKSFRSPKRKRQRYEEKQYLPNNRSPPSHQRGAFSLFFLALYSIVLLKQGTQSIAAVKKGRRCEPMKYKEAEGASWLISLVLH